jgi:hypothetical protein
MHSQIEDQSTLEQDARLDDPLRRVAFEAGMLLGLEAVRDEQQYHRRRLNRQQYWLHGYGTLAGMRVGMLPESHPDPDAETRVRLVVWPGIGIDGLGREILVHEAYCIELREWLTAQSPTALAEGFDAGAGRLWLKVCIRHKDCALARQPVLARKLNLGTDAVQPSRHADSVDIELLPELPPPSPADDAYQPWACHGETGPMPPLNASEQDTLDSASGAAAAQLRLHARLLHALDGGVATRDLAGEFHDGARVLLARVAIEASDIDAVIVNPNRISINNLVRPFVVSASQLAWLARQG